MGRRKLPINYIKTTGHTKPTPFQKVEATDATYKGNSWKPILATCRRWVSIFLSNATSSDFTYNLHRLGLIALFTTAKQKKIGYQFMGSFAKYQVSATHLDGLPSHVGDRLGRKLANPIALGMSM
jgi:hypothetical protein